MEFECGVERGVAGDSVLGLLNIDRVVFGAGVFENVDAGVERD
jgi:hypothetical protein